jgi:hypothetical protein
MSSPVKRLEAWCDLQEKHLIDPDGISRKLRDTVYAYRKIIAEYRRALHYTESLGVQNHKLWSNYLEGVTFTIHALADALNPEGPK